MALIDEFNSRLSLALRVQLTNWDDPAQTTVNTANLTLACDDVEDGEFEALMNEELDIADRKHVAFAVQLVRWKCMEFGAAPGKQAMEYYEYLAKRAKTLREIGPRDRVSPQTSSPLEPTEPTGNPPRPFFDDSFFTDIIPQNPGESTDIDNP